MAPKRGLGRGLSNLIPTDDTTEASHTHAQGFRTQSGLQQYFQIQSVIPALSGFPLGIETGAYD